jgi:hypothetical protein
MKIINKKYIIDDLIKKNKASKKIIILIIVLILIIISNNYNKYLFYKNFVYNKNKENNNIKVCLCTPCKQENRYIREFVDYYKNIGIDKIFLYDNNNIEGEKLEDVIEDYIKIGFVEILNWRGVPRPVIPIMNDCYKRNFNIYDWLAFYEVDEYIHLKSFTNIKPFLNSETFKYCHSIQLNWVYHTDNNLIYYDNRTLHERFPELEPNAIKNKKRSINSIKSILRGHIPNIIIDDIHGLNSSLKRCNGFGRSPRNILGINTKYCDFRYYYIDHYYTKSLQEFTEKLNRGDVAQGGDLWLKMHKISNYFERNKITLLKLEFIEKNTGLNLSEYKKKLQK